MKKDLTVVKANKLIEASYRLSLTEQRLVLFCISQMDSVQGIYGKKDEFRISVKDYQAFFGLTGKSVYRDIKAAEEHFFDRKFSYVNPETGRVRKTRWISAVEYDSDEGVTLQFSQDVLPFLSQIKGNYTQYRLEVISNLSSVHSIRIYELCLQYLKIGERVTGVEELKMILGLENQYSAYKDFNKWVLKPSIEQINKHTDIRIQMEPVKKPRKIIALKFKIKSKEKSHKKVSKQKIDSELKKIFSEETQEIPFTKAKNKKLKKPSFTIQ